MNAAADAPAQPARDLRERLVARISAEGPLTVAAYMAEALYDARAGYYRTKDPIGAGNDFITAPEVSQMFGELIGVWVIQAWLDLGAPERFDLVELGPGRGTMMSDVFRAARLKPEMLAAARVTLVETSPALENVQAATLADAPCSVTWADRLPSGDAPLIVLANEFLDCLPIRQFVRHGGDWRERMVGLDPEDSERLAFQLAPAPISDRDRALMPPSLRDADEGALVEACPGVEALIDALADRFAAAPGRALFIDYGPAQSEVGDTLQAVRAHEKVDPLAFPGEADLTARVDFSELARLAQSKSLDVAGPRTQGDWLLALGLEHRAAALRQSRPDQRETIARQVHRLTDDAEMGALFKVIAVSAPELPAPPGF